jgi:chromate transporter
MTERNKQGETISAEYGCISIIHLFIIWLRIGATSFGGGAVTQYLIQESFIYKHHWITSEEYANIIALCQIAPGINILAYTIIIGKRLAGWSGIGVSLLGLILPSALITIGITATYAHFSEFTKVQAFLRAVFAAIFGVALATNWRNVQPILLKNRKRGPLSLTIALLIMLCSSLIYVRFHPPVLVLYLFGGLCGALAYVHFSRNQQEH